MKHLPLFSIITPIFNRADMISDAVESVLSVQYPRVEHIIVDGGSTDGTSDILAQYPHLKVIVGPDQGMYDALNKGLKLATGEIIGFLNSDDLYAPNVFYEAIKAFQSERVLAVAGKAIVFSEMLDGTKNILNRFSPRNTSLLELSTLGSPFMNAWFFRKMVFDEIGNFNSTYRIVADRDFMLRLALSGLPYETHDTLVYQYRQHPNSMTFDITDLKFEQIANEHIKMTDVYLQHKSLPKPTRALIQQLRTHDTIEMTIRSAKNKNLRKIFRFFIAGIKYDLYWLFKFGQRALESLRGQGKTL